MKVTVFYQSNDWVVTNEYNDLRARDNLVHRKLFISKLPKKDLKI